MPVTTRRLVVAGVVAATAIAVPAAALAGGNGTTSKSPTTHAHSTPARAVAAKQKHKTQGGGTITPAQIAARLAARLGVSKAAAEHALQQLQGNVTSSKLAAIAHELGVTPAQLNAALMSVKESFAPPGSAAKPPGLHQRKAPEGRSLTSLPQAADMLASRLGVSLDAAQHAMHQIGVLSARDGGIESNSPQLAAIAHQLGVSRGQLNHALRAVKESFAGHR